MSLIDDRTRLKEGLTPRHLGSGLLMAESDRYPLTHAASREKPRGGDLELSLDEGCQTGWS
jgi:hypothetical protein